MQMYKSYRKDVDAAFKEAEKKSLELIGQTARTGVVDKITQNGQVDTGFMRNSVDYDNQGDKVIIGAAAFYSGFVDQGTSRRAGKPFLKPGVFAVANLFGKIAEKIYKEVLK